MRTTEEILQKIKQLGTSGEDIFGTMQTDLIYVLPFDVAELYLKEEVTEEEFNKIKTENTKEAILEKMRSYADFAWGKVEDRRGLSAIRNIYHYTAWTWLLGEDLPELEEDGEYYEYLLDAICQKYDLPSHLNSLKTAWA